MNADLAQKAIEALSQASTDAEMYGHGYIRITHRADTAEQYDIEALNPEQVRVECGPHPAKAPIPTTPTTAPEIEDARPIKPQEDM